MLHKLRPYQLEQHNSVFNYFANGGRGNPLIAAPTGTGKAFTIASICYTMVTQWPHVRGLMCTHVKELVDQNAQELWGAWSQAPLGIFSAGLKRKEFTLPLIFGGVKSVANNLDLFGWRDFMIVDEAHLVSPKATTMYQKLIKHFRNINPNFVTIGLSATIFRLGQGYLTDPVEKGNPIFTDVVCDHTTRECYARFVSEGYMAPLITKPTKVQLDLTGVKVTNLGDFQQNQLEQAVDKEAITYAALMEAMEYGHDRKAWLVFASGIDHAEHIAAMLNTFGITAVAVHSDTTRISSDERDRRIIAFKQGKIRALVNYKMLTTGFNHPAIDLIIDLYPTTSPSMHVQKYGRGTRPYTCGYYTKDNCLVLDYSGNTRRLGPIDDPVIPKVKGGQKGTAPVKTCEACNTFNHISVPNCIYCGSPFTFKVKIKETAASDAVMSSATPEVHWYDVMRVVHNLHTKDHTPNMIRITYLCPQGGSFSEFICPEHEGFAKHRAHEWWRQRHNSEPPKTTREWLNQLSMLRKPAKIRVWVNKRYPEVLSYEF